MADDQLGRRIVEGQSVSFETGFDRLSLPQDERRGVSRRALLGAAVSAPFESSFRRKPESTFAASSPPEGRWIPDQVRDDERDQVRDDGEWRSALAEYHAAEAEMRRVEGLIAGASAEVQGALEEVYGDCLDAVYAALRRLLVVPAPDFAAFAVKIELAIDHEVGTLTGGEACLAFVRGEARRLVSHQSGDLMGAQGLAG